MASRRTTHAAAVAWLVAVALLVPACGTGAASASPAQQASRSATPSTVASTAVGDPIAGLSIASPYTLDRLDAGKTAQIEQVKNGLGDVAAFVEVGARTVAKSGTSAGLLLAIRLPGVPPMSVLESMVTGAVGTAGATMTTRTIVGREARLVEGTTTSVAGYTHDATIVLAYGRSLKEAVAIITAVIEASE
jgi:hypothetical protein